MRISKLQLKQIWEGWTNLLFRFKNIKITTKYCKIISDELDIFNYENLNKDFLNDFMSFFKS